MYKISGYLWLAIVLGAALLAACQDDARPSGDFRITVDADGDPVVYRYNKRISVGQFLQEVGITLDEDDEVNPLIQSQIRDGMVITITRVVERQECETEPLPYETVTMPVQSMSPDDEPYLGQPGEEGVLQICYRVIEKDGVQTDRIEINRIPIKAPVNRIIYVGSEPPDTMLPIEGILTYISSGQAYIIEGNTANRAPLTESGYLDGRVFTLSVDGRQLLYTIRTSDTSDPEFSNELWVIMDTTANFPRPVQLVEDVRVAQWVKPYTISYSTANPTTDGAGWRAYNDLFVIQLDPESGALLPGTVEEVISSNAYGSYAYWGRRLLWSPDGTQLAWANADSLGLVDLGTGDFNTLMTFREYAPLLERYQGAIVWIPTLSWSTDGNLITTRHGEPYADEAPEDSVIFDMAVLDVNTGLQLETFISRTGIWSNPVYSPVVEGVDGNPAYSVAYFKARDPLNSPGTEYDLWIVDRDGSNERLVFPGPDRPGLRSPDPEDGIAWSPNARQIALIYQGNVWIIDLKSGQAIPVTNDGQASRPRWSQTS